MIGIVTSTWYPKFEEQGTTDHVRGTLALEMLGHVAGTYPYVVVDGEQQMPGGPEPPFHRAMRERGIAFVTQQQRGMSPGRQQGFAAIIREPSVEVVVWLEPEKVLFARDAIAIAAQPILSGQADVVIPARSKEGWRSLPPFQQGSERIANATFSNCLRDWGLWNEEQDLDVFFGPRVFNLRAHRHFVRQYAFTPDPAKPWQKAIRPAAYSNAIFYPVMAARCDGLRVVSVEVPYVYPPEQTVFETGNEEFDAKRIMQASSIHAELLQLRRLLAGELNAPLRLLA